MPRLLLIEDDSDIRVLLDRFLKRSGFDVTCAADGDAGLKAFHDAPFDIVVTDGLLPKKSGYEVSAAIRKHPRGRDVGVIMITAAFKGPKARKEAFDEGVDAFFTKPFVLGDLRDKLVELLAKQGLILTPAPAPAPAPAAASKPAAAPVRVVRVEPPPLPRELRVDAPATVARALLTCARHRLSGVVELVDGANTLKLAYLRGVVVGATDNLREHLLGERLWKQGKLTTEQMRTLNNRIQTGNERVAEALLALGYCTPDDALALVDEQAIARVRRALLWTGVLRVVEDEAKAQQLAVSSLEIIDVILAFALEPGQAPEAERFVAAHKAAKVEKAPDFDSSLLALARIKPDAALPAVVLAGERSVAETAAASSPAEVWAAWLGGLVRLPDDPPSDPRPLPDVLRAEISGALVDRDFASRICAMLVRARGRSFYEIIEVKPDIPSAQAMKILEDIATDLGPGAAEGRSLGPAAAAARELWEILDDAYRTFADDGSRAMYDAILEPVAPRSGGGVGAAKNEDAFLEGQGALERGELARALGCFEVAAASRPLDAEYQSYLGWAQVLNGDGNGVTRLMTAMRENPQTMRPLFFLGLVAAKDGDAPKARALLEECVRRAPLDVEVQATLRSLS